MLVNAPENNRNNAVPTSASMTNATSTSSIEKPRMRLRAAARQRPRRAARARSEDVPCRARLLMKRAAYRVGSPAGGHSVIRDSIRDGDAPGEPIDVDFELALARGDSDAAAIRSAIREKTNEAHLFVDDVAL